MKSIESWDSFKQFETLEEHKNSKRFVVHISRGYRIKNGFAGEIEMAGV